MGRRKKKAAKVAQWEKVNNPQNTDKKVVIEDPAENVMEEVVTEMTEEDAVIADVEEVIAEVEEKTVAKSKKKKKKAKSEDQ